MPSVNARPIKLARNFTCSSVPKWKVSSPTVHFQLSEITPDFATTDVALGIAANDVVKKRHGKSYAEIVNALSMTSTARWSMARLGPAGAEDPGGDRTSRRGCRDSSRHTTTNRELEKRHTMATRKMNAALVEQFGKPLVLREWDIPTPGAGQILVKTEACGVCHTDLHAANGDWPPKARASIYSRPRSRRPRLRCWSGSNHC